jgi:hypothetical protein
LHIAEQPAHVKGNLLDLVLTSDPVVEAAVAEDISDRELIKVRLPFMTLHRFRNSCEKHFRDVINFTAAKWSYLNAELSRVDWKSVMRGRDADEMEKK